MVKKLTEYEIRILRRMVNFTCQICHQKEEKVGKLTPHRIKRGNAGGEYTPNNILMVCNECHKEIHGNEFK